MTVINDITGITSPFVKNMANTMVALRKCEIYSDISYFDFQAQVYNDTVIIAIYLSLLIINFALREKFKYHYVIMMYFSSNIIRNCMVILNTYNDDIQVLFTFVAIIAIFWMSEYKYSHSYINSIITGTLNKDNCGLYFVLIVISNVAYFIYNMTKRDVNQCIMIGTVHLFMIEKAELYVSIIILLHSSGYELYKLLKKRAQKQLDDIKLEIPHVAINIEPHNDIDPDL